MSTNSDEYTRERVKELTPSPVYSNIELAIEIIRNPAEEGVIEFLVDEHEIDLVHKPTDKQERIRDAILRSDAPFELKQKVESRGDTTPQQVVVPDRVKNTALGALKAGKPLVLYGPTGTGKTTFAKQLALDTSVGYILDTASPSWTRQEIVGRIAPDFSRDNISYRKELGCVSEGVVRSRQSGEDYAVIIDELTRADISRIFGPLYTAIENPHQTIFETEEHGPIRLENSVNIICTMNMSDRTVNELDNAITRRFAMVELDSYSESSREQLFQSWISSNIDPDIVDHDAIENLFHSDYNGLNGASDEDGIVRFGPMHYADVAKFLGVTTGLEGEYEAQSKLAVGEAFRTYIVPRLLNSSSYAQENSLIEHYEELNDEHTEFDLTPAIDLIKKDLRSMEQRMGNL